MQLSITFTPPDDLPAASEAAVATFPGNQFRLKPKMLFDNFVTGGSNQLAHAAARQAAENPGVDHNALYIYGPSGTGKTHLLHAIGTSSGGKAVTRRWLT